jgi:hypothetical protein
MDTSCDDLLTFMIQVYIAGIVCCKFKETLLSQLRTEAGERTDDGKLAIVHDCLLFSALIRYVK